MKNLIINILLILFNIGMIVLSFLYIIPKMKNKPTKFSNFVDNLTKWLSSNWIWCIVILLVICIICMSVYIALAQKGKI